MMSRVCWAVLPMSLSCGLLWGGQWRSEDTGEQRPVGVAGDGKAKVFVHRRFVFDICITKLFPIRMTVQ